jgi:TetR/AcrR family tetracycline transcriptional repressor
MAIDRKEIVDAALTLLNEVGMDKLSTRALAAKLGVAQPALYWHFRNKDELLDAINAEMIARYHTHHMPKPRERWDSFTLATARSMRRALLTVRDGARVNAGTRPTPGQFEDAERQLKLYVGAGFTPEAALHMSIAIARYVVGFALEEQAERERDEPIPEGEEATRLAAELAAYPLLNEAIGPLVRAGSINSEAVFEGGLGYLVAGFRASLGRKT